MIEFLASEEFGLEVLNICMSLLAIIFAGITVLSIVCMIKDVIRRFF